MKVIGLAGLARSGKDTVADYIGSKYGYMKFVLSDVLKDELAKQGKEPTKENMADLGNTLRKKSGKDIVARMLYERCKGLDKITIVGFRSPEEVQFFQKKAKNFTLIEVRAPEQSRVKWASKQEDIKGRDKNDILKKGLEDVFSIAKIKIDNNSTLEALYAKVEKIMKDIG